MFKKRKFNCIYFIEKNKKQRNFKPKINFDIYKMLRLIFELITIKINTIFEKG